MMRKFEQDRYNQIFEGFIILLTQLFIISNNLTDSLKENKLVKFYDYTEDIKSALNDLKSHKVKVCIFID